MKYIKQFAIIIFISFIGEILNQLIPLPIPASIYGILILLICLGTKVIHVSAVKETGSFLIDIMPLLFLPAVVGLVDSWSILRSAWIQYIVIIVVTTFVVMAVSGRAAQAVIRHSAKKGGGENA